MSSTNCYCNLKKKTVNQTSEFQIRVYLHQFKKLQEIFQNKQPVCLKRNRNEAVKYFKKSYTFIFFYFIKIFVRL